MNFPAISKPPRPTGVRYEGGGGLYTQYNSSENSKWFMPNGCCKVPTDDHNKIWMDLYETSIVHSTSSGILIFKKIDIKRKSVWWNIT